MIQMPKSSTNNAWEFGKNTTMRTKRSRPGWPEPRSVRTLPRLSNCEGATYGSSTRKQRRQHLPQLPHAGGCERGLQRAGNTPRAGLTEDKESERTVSEGVEQKSS